MAQYCRYCNHLFVNSIHAWCDELEKPISEAAAKRTNKCKLFEFNPIDALDYENPNPKEYQPRLKGEDYEYCGNLFEGQANVRSN